MTDEIAMQWARELAAAESPYPFLKKEILEGKQDFYPPMKALTKHLREVSDAVESYFKGFGIPTALHVFILPKPKPDPLVEAIRALQDGRAGSTPESYAACLRAELASQGIKLEGEG